MTPALRAFQRRGKIAARLRLKRATLPGKRPQGRPRKASWPPCVRCGDPDGPIGHGCVTPNRHRAERYGYPEGAKVCSKCDSTLRKRMRKGARA